MHSQRLFSDADRGHAAGLAAETLASVITVAAEEIDGAERQQARILFGQRGVVGETLRGVTDADLQSLPVELDAATWDQTEKHRHIIDKARDDVNQAGRKQGLDGFA